MQFEWKANVPDTIYFVLKKPVKSVFLWCFMK